MVEVFVEKWLTEEQYAKAKAEGLLAWQESENLPKDAKSGSIEKAPEGKENQSQDERPRAVSTTAITVSRVRPISSCFIRLFDLLTLDSPCSAHRQHYLEHTWPISFDE
jgi:hypothetical protein